jgi:hypothetical protein
VYRHILVAIGLLAGSTAQAQSPDRASIERIPGPAPVTLSHDMDMGPEPSSFRARIRGDLSINTSGKAEFGTVKTTDRSSAAVVVSLGVCDDQSAILFTRRNGTPLNVGRYRVAEGANGADEIMALVLTGSPTRPTGVFWGRSGWLVVTEASDRLLTGRFEVDGVGFRAAEPEREDRALKVSGSFSAAAASSSSQAGEIQQ